MQLELFYHDECGFSRQVLNTIKNLKIGEKIVLKHIIKDPDFEDELVALCGNAQVPTLKVDGKPMRESEVINRFLVEQFVD